MIKKDAKNIEGFTLLEILIALLILATVISIIFSSYTATFRNISDGPDYTWKNAGRSGM